MALVHFSIASEQKAEIERKLKLHKAKLATSKPVIDTSIPSSLILAPKQLLNGNVKRAVVMENDRITKENFHLAQRLFHIMGKPSEMSTAINQQPIFNPQTNNFRVRLEEAQKINMLNQKIAEKLEAVKPSSYLLRDGGGINNVCIDGKTKLPFIRVLHGEETSPLINIPGHLRPQTLDLQHLSAATDSSIERLRTKIVAKLQGRHLTLNTDVTSPTSPAMKSKSPKPRKPKIILECTKEQGEYVIDTVVMKEPFRDRFAIFGIDVISGQRFELFIQSESVFNILEGEMLVTSVEKKNVWRAVLDRVSLNKVERFSKIKVAKAAMGLHPSLEPLNNNNNNNNNNSNHRALEHQGRKQKEHSPLDGQTRAEEQETEQNPTRHNNNSHNSHNNNGSGNKSSHNNNSSGNKSSSNNNDNHHVTRASALCQVVDLNVWEVHEDDDLIGTSWTTICD